MQKTVWLLIAALFVLLVPASAQFMYEAADQPMVVQPPDVSEQEAVAPVEPLLDDSVVRPDRNIFQRAPLVDGKIDDGEWDVFYTVDNAYLRATTFANWTEDALYIGAHADKPIDMMVLLDAKCDGWFHGADNYQIKVTGNGVSPKLEILHYNSLIARNPEPQPLPINEQNLATVKSSTDQSGYMVELVVPKLVLQEWNPQPNSSIGMRVAVRSSAGEAEWIPTTTLGDVEECSLVDCKSAALDPLQMGLMLRNTRVVCGEDVHARLYIQNNGTEPVETSAFVIGGEGKTAQYLNSQMVRIEKLQNGKRVRHDFSSKIPSNMPLGYYAVGAELKEGPNRIGGAIASFEVVEPFEATLRMDPEFIAGADAQRVIVVIRNNAKQPLFGRATISVPEGWQLVKDRNIRSFNIRREDGVQELKYDISVPEDATGKATISVNISIANQEPIILSREITVK